MPSLIAAYPLTFISIYFSVALAEVLAGRLDGKETTTAEGFSAANKRIGLIAAWSLLACTVGLALRALEQRLPLAGRIAAWLFGMAWSLATIFAVPILAYEGLGPFETLKRSAQIFKRRWGTQIGGSIGIGAASAVVAIPLVLLLFVGFAVPGGGGGGPGRARRRRPVRARRGGLGDGADLPRVRLPQRRRHGHLRAGPSPRKTCARRSPGGADPPAPGQRPGRGLAGARYRLEISRASSTSSRTPNPDAPLPT